MILDDLRTRWRRAPEDRAVGRRFRAHPDRRRPGGSHRWPGKTPRTSRSSPRTSASLTATRLDVYLQRGGWQGFRKALTLPPAALVDEVKKSNLRGRGGAGFPTGLKWTFIPKEARDGLPGRQRRRVASPAPARTASCWPTIRTCLLEGMVDRRRYALGCKHAYIYIRGEMMREAQILQAAIDEAYAGGYLGKDHPPPAAPGTFKLDITLHRGAGAYICGEETALLNSLEGKRGWPRLKPPFPAVKGLFRQPTIVNNVETLVNVPDIVDEGRRVVRRSSARRSRAARASSACRAT